MNRFRDPKSKDRENEAREQFNKIQPDVSFAVDDITPIKSELFEDANPMYETSRKTTQGLNNLRKLARHKRKHENLKKGAKAKYDLERYDESKEVGDIGAELYAPKLAIFLKTTAISSSMHDLVQSPKI